MSCTGRGLAAFAVLIAFAFAAPAEATPAEAKKLNNAGMKAYKKGDYEAAQALFEKAIAADPAMVKPHYNRASMAALQLDVAVVLEELAWLAKSSDPAAAKSLAAAKSDSDFTAVSLSDPVRVAMGLPKLADTKLDDLALAYGGWWNGIDEGMMQGWVEMHFLAGGKLKGRDHSGESGTWSSWTGTWRVDGRTIQIKIGKQDPVAYALEECSDMGEGAVCLVRDEGGVFYTPGKYR